MKVFFVNPPIFHQGRIPIDRLIQSGAVYAPLGLLYIAASLRQARPQDEINLMDYVDFKKDPIEVSHVVQAFQPDIVGLTANSIAWYDASQTIRSIKQAKPDTCVIVGGPHIEIFPDETLRYHNVDAVMQGEGEQAFPMFVEAVESGSDPATVPGVRILRNNEIVSNPEIPIIPDLGKLPFPAHDLLWDPDRYKFSTDLDMHSVTMLASRGCPFRCTFCAGAKRGYRLRPAGDIVQEMQRHVDRGIRGFNFIDDMFNLRKEHTLELCKSILQQNLEICFSFRGRVDTLDEESALALKEAGCTRINFGVESGADRILEQMNKKITTDQIRNANALTKKFGFQTVAYFMVGFPGEAFEDVQKTKRLIMEMDPDFVQVTILLLYPGTEIYKRALAEGVLERDYFTDHVKKPEKNLKVRVWDQTFSERELIGFQRSIFRSFYLRPSYLWRTLKRIRSMKELYRKVLIGFMLLYYIVTKKR